MRKLFLGLILLGLTHCSSKTTLEKPLKEVRGVWITNIDSNVMFSQDSIAIAMKSLADQGFNVVFPVVWNKGFTLYPSQVMANEFGEKFRQDAEFVKANIDPLEVMIFEAHKNGLEIIPWFEFGFSSSYKENGGHIVKAKPEWAAKDSTGALLHKNNFEWLNGINPEVQQFITSLIFEVITNYDVDGIQGDDRLPAMPAHGGYDSYTKKIYKSEMGVDVPSNAHDSTFLAWKANKLSEFATKLYKEVKSYDSDLIVSFSPSVYPWSKQHYLQDSPNWYSNQSVDLLIPQNYRYEIERYKSTLDEVLQFHPGITQPTSFTTLSAGILIKAGEKYNDYTYVKEAIAYNRKNGIDGEVFFFYEGLDEKNGHLGDSLALNEYREKAELPYRKNEYRPKPIYANSTSYTDSSLINIQLDISKVGVYDFYSRVKGTAVVNWDKNPESEKNILVRSAKSDLTKEKMNGWFWMGQYEIQSKTKIGFSFNLLNNNSNELSSSEVLILYNHLESKSSKLHD